MGRVVPGGWLKASKAAVGLTVAALGVAGPLAMDDTTGPQRWHPNSTDVSTVASATRGAAMLPLHTRSSLAKPVLSLPGEQAGATRTTRTEPMGVESLVPAATFEERIAAWAWSAAGRSRATSAISDSRIARFKKAIGSGAWKPRPGGWRAKPSGSSGGRVPPGVAALCLAVKDAAARLAALGPFRPSLTAQPCSAG